jgi:hypothetical protein
LAPLGPLASLKGLSASITIQDSPAMPQPVSSFDAPASV